MLNGIHNQNQFDILWNPELTHLRVKTSTVITFLYGIYQNTQRTSEALLRNPNKSLVKSKISLLDV